MTRKEFDASVKETFDKCFELVTAKGKFYGQQKDRLGQIKKIAVITGTNNIQAAYNLVAKHFVALGEMAENEKNFTSEDFDAYLLDIAIYMSIIRALIQDE